jgi:hypothetical protein
MAVIRNRGKNARNVSRKIWLSPAEAEQIRDAAGDVPVATWLRDLALGQPSKPHRSRRQETATRTPKFAGAIQPLAVAVARVGNNLNQIARAVNRALKSRQPLDAVLIANQLAHLRHEMRDELQTVSGQFLREVNRVGKDI